MMRIQIYLNVYTCCHQWLLAKVMSFSLVVVATDKLPFPLVNNFPSAAGKDIWIKLKGPHTKRKQKVWIGLKLRVLAVETGNKERWVWGEWIMNKVH